MREYANQIFEDTEIALDGLKAIDVIFNRCRLTFRGEGDVSLDGCDIQNCDLVFSGAAASAITFIKVWGKASGLTYAQIIDGDEGEEVA